MRIQPNPNKKLQASAMIAVAIFAVLISSTLAAYLLMVQNEYTQVGRSQSWNNTIVLAEAGVEEGLALVNVYVGNGNATQIPNWTATASANGWTQSGNLYTKSNTVASGLGYYIVTVDNTSSSAPAITALGVAAWSLGTASAARPMFAQASMSVKTSQSQVTREIYIQTSYSALFSGALTAKGTIDFKGNNVTIDSFDSADPNYSTWNAANGFGTYTSTKRKGNGNVATDDAIAGAIAVQNANIYGTVNTGPGGTASVGANGSVGSLVWVNAGTTGIQPGYSDDDMNVTFSDVSLPNNSWTLTAATSISGSGSAYYQINSLGNLNISATGPTPFNVTLYLPNGFSYSGNKAFNIGTNCNVTIYTAGDISTGGNGSINNATQNALALQIYGLPGCTSIDFHGNAAFIGSIYAPEASFIFGGGGNNTQDFIGAAVVSSASMNGKANFHYDENLARKGPGRGYIPTAWKEVVTH